MTNCATLRPSWTPMNIALMILGFIVFWPLGLAMLAYILWGDQMHDLYRDMRGNFNLHAPAGIGAASGNAAFDEYRKAELKRLDEERRRLDEERAEFEDFVRNLRRAKDKEEFESFKSARNKPARTKKS